MGDSLYGEEDNDHLRDLSVHELLKKHSKQAQNPPIVRQAKMSDDRQFMADAIKYANVNASPQTNTPNKVLDINPNKTIGGRKITNSDLAGTTVKTKGGDVMFDND
jgi:hypothetical protein